VLPKNAGELPLPAAMFASCIYPGLEIGRAIRSLSLVVQSGATVPIVHPHVYADFFDTIQTIRFKSARLHAVANAVEKELSQLRVLFTPTKDALDGFRKLLCNHTVDEQSLRSTIVEDLFSPMATFENIQLARLTALGML
jgi:hypothetical protein